MRRIVLFALVTCFVPFMAAAPASAQATRTWVSGVGDDVNPCSRTAPCKTFAGAISKTAAGGEINCLDPGGFGTVSINKALTIACQGDTFSILASGTNGINVNAGANDAVVIRGISIQGAITGQVGISFNTGKSLLLDKVSISGFNTGIAAGVNFRPSAISTLSVSNSNISNNGTAAAGGGIIVTTTGVSGFARAVVNNVVLDRNFIGVTATGIGQTASAQVFQSVITGSNGAGLQATGTGGAIKVGGSAILGNGAAATSGNVSSYLNNEILDNGTDTTPPTTGGLH